MPIICLAEDSYLVYTQNLERERVRERERERNSTIKTLKSNAQRDLKRRNEIVNKYF